MPTNSGWRTRTRVAGLLLTLILAACGGGGGAGGKDATPSATASDDGMRTMSGVLSLVETAAVDSDTNDPNQAHRAPNDDFDTAQPLTTPVNLVGTVNDPSTGPDGPNKANGDQTDGYVVDLQADQVVELTFAADATQNNLDLAIFDNEAQPNVVALSNGTGNSECVRISKAGRYYIGVLLIRGASVYNLRVGAPGTSSVCPTATAASASPSILAGQLIALPRAATTTAAGKSSMQMQSVAMPAAAQLQAAAGVTQLSVPAGVPTLLTLPATARDRLKGLARIASYSSFKRASTLSQAAAVARPSAGNSMARMRDTLVYAHDLMATGQYAYVDLNHTVRPTQVQKLVGTFPPDDPFYANQRWHYEQINLPAAMERLANLPAQPTRRPLVAVIDSGIVSNHPDLLPQIEGGRTFVSINTQGDADSANPDDPDIPGAAGDPSFHGSHVAGTIAASTFDGIGAAGIAPMAKLMPLRVFDPANGGGASDFDIIHAMLYAAGLPNRSRALPARKADVINMSLGGTNACQASYVDIIRQVRQAGVIIVAAAGNAARNNSGTPVAVGTPANCPGVVAVGALDAQRRQADYSQSGPELRVSAPGGDMSRSTTGNPVGDMVFSTVATFTSQSPLSRVPTYNYMEGTSMASPHMAGVVALMKYAYPGLTPDKLDEWLNAGKLTDDIDSAGHDTRTGFGLINARKAVDVALAEAQTPGPAPQGKIVATPFSLDFGAQRSSMSVVLTTTAATTDVVTKLTPSSQALNVSPTNVDAKTRLGTYTIMVDRSLLPSGTTFLSLSVQTSHDTVSVPITVVKQGSTGTSRSGDYGPIYVLAVDATTDEVVKEATVTAKDGQYAWALKAPKGSRLYLVAGGDLDQNQFICDAGEPCGGYPLLSNSLSTITLDDNMAGLNFSIAPMGMGGATAASLTGGQATGRPGATLRFRRPAP